MPISYYEYNEDGILVPVDKEHAKIGGRYRIIDGVMVRLGESSITPSHYYGSDDLGTQGILNHADGKMYDSRSEYAKAVKAKGCVIVGDDAPTKSTYTPPQIDWKAAVAETVYNTPTKGN